MLVGIIAEAQCCAFPCLESAKKETEGASGGGGKRVRGRGSPVLLATAGYIWAARGDRHALSPASFAA